MTSPPPQPAPLHLPQSVARPPPPPRAPPGSVRHVAWQAKPPAEPLQPSKRSPVSSSASVPRHDRAITKLLKCLEEDSLSVTEVVGMLEAELGSPPPLAVASEPRSPRGSSMPARQRPPSGNSVDPSALRARLEFLEQNVRTLAQALAGIGSYVFNWTLSNSIHGTDRIGLWHVLLVYMQPCVSVDGHIAETVKSLKAAIGTEANRGSVIAHQASLGGLSQLHSKGTFDKSAPHAGGMRNLDCAGDPSPQVPLPCDMPNVGGGTSARIGATSHAMQALKVSFTASRAAQKLNGVYTRVQGGEANGRPIYKRGDKHIVHLGNAAWVIKDDWHACDWHAYVKSSARDPHSIHMPWNVPDDGGGFVLDSHGCVTPCCIIANSGGPGCDLSTFPADTQDWDMI